MSAILGVLAGVIMAFGFLLWITRGESSRPDLTCLEEWDSRYRLIWGEGLDPVWNTHYNTWVADGPSIVNRLIAAEAPEGLVRAVTPMITKTGGIRVVDVINDSVVERDATGKVCIRIHQETGE